MTPAGNSEKDSTKIHGDKLDRLEHESEQAGTPAASALDQLQIPPHEEPQTDGGAKIHGDKLDPHSGTPHS